MTSKPKCKTAGSSEQCRMMDTLQEATMRFICVCIWTASILTENIGMQGWYEVGFSPNYESHEIDVLTFIQEKILVSANIFDVYQYPLFADV